METRKEDGSSYNTGANKSAEDGGADDEVDPTSVSGINVVLNSRLAETGFANKKAFQVYLKDYLKKIKTYHTDKPGFDVAAFQAQGVDLMKFVTANFKDLVFYTGETMDPEAAVPMCIWDDETPVMYFFKNGLKEEKV